MSTKNPRWAALNFILLLLPRRFDEVGIKDHLAHHKQKLRYGGLNAELRMLKVFDPANRDLGELQIGYFERKYVCAPAACLPRSKSELSSFCRQLVDRGENELHLDLMLANLPGGRSLDEHVSDLWKIQSIDAQLYADVVQGFHGEVIRRARLPEFAVISLTDLKAMLARQGLLWCAMDVQVAICGARVATEAPLGDLLDGDMVEPKIGTIKRLIRDAMDDLLWHLAHYQTLEEELLFGKNHAKPRGKVAKMIAAAAENLLPKGSEKLIRAQLDKGIPFVRSVVKRLSSDAENWSANPLHTPHAFCNSGLTPLAATAGAILRYVQAEQNIEQLIDEAFRSPAPDTPKAVDPLPPPPAGLDRSSPIFLRALDLIDSGRRAQFNESNNNSRSAGLQLPDEQRDPEDFSGLTFLTKAYDFLMESGQRSRAIYKDKRAHSQEQQTYFRIDVVPELRLALVREQGREPKILG